MEKNNQTTCTAIRLGMCIYTTFLTHHHFSLSLSFPLSQLFSCMQIISPLQTMCISTYSIQYNSPSLMKLWSFRKVVVSLSTEMVWGLSPLLGIKPLHWLEERGTREASSLISSFSFWRRLRDVDDFFLADCWELCAHYMTLYIHMWERQLCNNAHPNWSIYIIISSSLLCGC